MLSADPTTLSSPTGGQVRSEDNSTQHIEDRKKIKARKKTVTYDNLLYHNRLDAKCFMRSSVNFCRSPRSESVFNFNSNIPI